MIVFDDLDGAGDLTEGTDDGATLPDLAAADRVLMIDDRGSARFVGA